MSRSRASDLWDSVAPDFDQIGPHFFAQTGRRLVELARIPSGANVLDVATGRGGVLFPAASRAEPRGCVVGVDLSRGMVHETATQVRRLGIGHVRVCQMEADRLAFRDDSFDTVLCGHAIFWFRDAVAEFYRVLRPGGQVGLSVVRQGTTDWLWEALNAHLPAQDPPRGEDADPDRPDVLTPGGMEALLNAAGFVDIDVVQDEYDLVYADAEEWWSAMWTLACRSDMEAMEPATLASFRSEIFRRLRPFTRPDGVHIHFGVLFAAGVKPRRRRAEAGRAGATSL